MTFPATEIDKVSVELATMAKVYATSAAALASDPYFREAIVKVSVSGFVWALHAAFDDPSSRAALDHELKVQSAAVDRAVNGGGPRN